MIKLIENKNYVSVYLLIENLKELGSEFTKILFSKIEDIRKKHNIELFTLDVATQYGESFKLKDGESFFLENENGETEEYNIIIYLIFRKIINLDDKNIQNFINEINSIKLV